MQNQDMKYRIPEFAPNETNDLFCNDWVVMKSWIEQTRYHDGSHEIKEMLDIARQMLAFRPRNRLYMWKAEMDLHERIAFRNSQW